MSTTCGKPDTILRFPLELLGSGAKGAASRWKKATFNLESSLKALKQQLRNQMRKKRQALTPSQRQQFSENIATRLFQSNDFQRAQHIALYHSLADEVSTTHIFKQACLLQKSCYFPIISTHGTLTFVKVDEATALIPGHYGILTPAQINQTIALEALDLVLFPLLAFDSAGNRLGMGGGYYDKTFAKVRSGQSPRLVGLAYDLQCVEDLPHSDLDIKLDEIITEKQIYRPA